MSTTEASVENARVSIDKALIPQHVLDDIGRTLFKSFMESIQDPEKLRLYNELGKAFMERRAAKAKEGGSK